MRNLLLAILILAGLVGLALWYYRRNSGLVLLPGDPYAQIRQNSGEWDEAAWEANGNQYWMTVNQNMAGDSNLNWATVTAYLKGYNILPDNTTLRAVLLDDIESFIAVNGHTTPAAVGRGQFLSA